MRKTIPAITLVVAALTAAIPPAGVSLAAASTAGTPLADAGPDQRVPKGSNVTLDATGSRDPDGRSLTYRWEARTPSGDVVLPAPPTAGRTSLTVPTPGTYEVIIIVTDDERESAGDTLYVVVKEQTVPTPAPPASPSPTTTPPFSTAAPTLVTNPTATVPSGSGPDCADPFAVECLDVPSELPGCAKTLTEECFNYVTIDGPPTLSEGETVTYTARTFGFDPVDVTVRWQTGALSRSVERSFPPATTRSS
jgi:hypothetical protein